ncbi:DUF5412 family protein [Aneurinibacillus aneurinilyticus]|jgi:uncharacterized protein (UPF0333 family)|uniref:DUF5412 domain-containing protein n=2 Tax=Aneurinibacillus aneurinilyticus TaxID=1391 RepID=A0A848D5M0_ANEAE|nr:DUF5412 family protein [Aneurinibacillus aneurinilyticus]ERI09734.1 hypothetical protein HMPREF0083_02190 [Aneurinibacillus aneurinilyticus ATCC 12856]MED0707169.1 DUF5412 family protein [Aneurinibacillus aneurinilyticus]MED0723443.1 DUF5412 family protein [Aneurinibacillus aneurinilyticus]MED0732762.1 DUF5412 family protein [Aneurinibacillus aneurinilyticus]MED0740468.1 DUF5412 family protein [Aneurinibacillus aneurinilyticus]
MAVKKRFLFSLLIFILISGGILGYVYYLLFYSMSNLPEGKFVKQVDSPDKSYAVRMYIVEGNATVATTVRGELLKNKKGTKKNIYWDYRITDTNVKWVDPDTVSINGHKLDVEKDIYDFRRER